MCAAELLGERREALAQERAAALEHGEQLLGAEQHRERERGRELRELVAGHGQHVASATRAPGCRPASVSS